MEKILADAQINTGYNEPSLNKAKDSESIETSINNLASKHGKVKSYSNMSLGHGSNNQSSSSRRHVYKKPVGIGEYKTDRVNKYDTHHAKSSKKIE